MKVRFVYCVAAMLVLPYGGDVASTARSAWADEHDPFDYDPFGGSISPGPRGPERIYPPVAPNVRMVRARELAPPPRQMLSAPLNSDAPLAERMQRRTSCRFHNTRLEAALYELLAPLERSFHIDRPALDSIGLSADSETTLALYNVSAQTALDFMLRGLDPELTWLERDGVVVITTREEAEKALERRMHDVMDILRWGDPNLEYSDGYSYELVEAIREIVEPDSWDNNGGPGAMEMFNGILIVRQTHQVHLDVEKFLTELRRTRAARGKK